MITFSDLWQRLTGILSRPSSQGLALLLARIALAGIFWRSGRTKVAEGSWLQLSDTTRYLFETEYAGVPLAPDLAAPLALYAEHLFPALLVLGLATRFSAFALLGLTLVIQLFVYPEAWWTTHIVWAALAGMLITIGAGIISLDHLVCRRLKP